MEHPPQKLFGLPLWTAVAVLGAAAIVAYVLFFRRRAASDTTPTGYSAQGLAVMQNPDESATMALQNQELSIIGERLGQGFEALGAGQVGLQQDIRANRMVMSLLPGGQEAYRTYVNSPGAGAMTLADLYASLQAQILQQIGSNPNNGLSSSSGTSTNSLGGQTSANTGSLGFYQALLASLLNELNATHAEASTGVAAGTGSEPTIQQALASGQMHTVAGVDPMDPRTWIFG
jgi:hypothetical protein